MLFAKLYIFCILFNRICLWTKQLLLLEVAVSLQETIFSQYEYNYNKMMLLSPQSFSALKLFNQEML